MPFKQDIPSKYLLVTTEREMLTENLGNRPIHLPLPSVKTQSLGGFVGVTRIQQQI